MPIRWRFWPVLVFAGALASLHTSGDTIYVSGSLYSDVSPGVVELTSSGVSALFAANSSIGSRGLAFDGSGNLYVANWTGDAIEKFTPAAVGSVFASGLSSPLGLAFDHSGNLYVTEFLSNSVISKITPTGSVTQFADSSDGLNVPYGLAVDSTGNLYAANYMGTTITKFTNGVASTFATIPEYSYPTGMAFDSSGNLYVAYSGSDTIEKFTRAGVGSVFATGLHNPQGLAFDSAGNLYVANDSSGSSAENGFPDTIEKITPQGAASIFSTEVAGPMFVATSTLNVNITKIVSLSTGTVTFPPTRNGGIENFSITNTGNAPLVVTGISYTGTSGVFSGNYFGYLAPGANSGDIAISFNPTGTGTFSGVATLLSNATGGTSSITLSGVAGSVPSITSTGSATFTAGIPISFTVTASGVPAPTFSVPTGLPSWTTLDSTTGIITGTPPNTTGSPFILELVADNGIAQAYQFATFTIVSPPAPVTYSAWQVLTGTSSGPTATPLNDGVSNLLKYLCDINPAAPMSTANRAALPEEGVSTLGGTSYQTLTYRQYAPESGITVNVQTSPDLQTWTTVATESTSTLSIPAAGVAVVQTGSDPTTGDPILQAQVPVSGTEQFLRLEVTQP